MMPTSTIYFLIKK